MKALSVTRPWPTFMFRRDEPVKTIENRTWFTPYRGPLLIHAARSWQGSALDFVWQKFGLTGLSWDQHDYPLGIVGLVDVVDVCAAEIRPGRVCECGGWAAFGQYHWRIANPRPLVEPVPCKGSLGLWVPPADVMDAVRVQMEEAVRG